MKTKQGVQKQTHKYTVREIKGKKREILNIKRKCR